MYKYGVTLSKSIQKVTQNKWNGLFGNYKISFLNFRETYLLSMQLSIFV